MKVFIAGIACSLACLFLGASQGSASLLTENCGTTEHPSRIRRVVGGHDANRFENPWMVMVIGKDNMFVCGGSLITSLFVLTSASCISSSPKQVSLGEYDRNCRSEDCLSSRKLIDIEQQFIHPQFQYYQNDIALLRLATEVVFSAYIRPICLSVDRPVGSHIREFTATGWGKTDSSETSNVLQTTTLKLHNPIHCNDKFRTKLDASQLCIGGEHSDTCNGDSGGPLSAKVSGGKTDRVFLFGLVSYGSSFCSGIAVYTNVQHYRDWIVNTIAMQGS
ncbi:serine protease grass [Drosophila takahashii]|uniref:serine protease grass n=1 Tax=Drosophila takahashii TaxID=29030 RepID=UPI001CF8D658|nr:serine protease grass [Drosophila takahashii]